MTVRIGNWTVIFANPFTCGYLIEVRPPAPSQEPLNGLPMTREAKADRRAVDRAENEGMLVQTP